MKKQAARIASIIAAAGLGLSAATLIGCNTVKGAGQDLQDASDATKEAISGEDASDD